jgi:pimeloyl-ACP methyl ester carboxylesterase
MARPFDLVPLKITRLGPSPVKARREALFLHGAWSGPDDWEGLAEPIARAGFGVNLLELPGHGQPVWELPAFTSLKDYAAYAARAAANLGHPILVAHSMGGWIAQKLLEVVDLPAVFLAPLPGSGLPLWGLMNFVRDNPRQVLEGLRGRPMRFEGMGGIGEPSRVTWEMGLGLVRARPKPGNRPRLLIAAGKDHLVPLGAQRRLAHRLGAGLMVFDDLPHVLWQEDPGGRVCAAVLHFLDKTATG